MNPIGGTILVVLLAIIMGGSRRVALLGAFAGILYLTQGQQLNVGGFNMFAIRFIELGAFTRVMARREFSFSSLNLIDKLFIVFQIFTTVIFLLRTDEGQAYQIGVTVDAFLAYFAFRGLISSFDDFREFCIGSVYLLIPFTLLVMIESITRQNPFNIMGGVLYGDWMREGRLRCQGSFRHPSLLGTLGACLIPLYIGLFMSHIRRGLAILGIILCLMIVFASNSGGPLNATAFGLLGWGFWRLRLKMKLVRRLLVVFLFILGMSMKAPIWYLLAKMSALTGGDGWHRSYLMDVAFQNLGKWWFVGMPFTETWDWFPYGLTTTGAADITNVFIAYGLTAGLGSIVLFILLLVKAYSRIGRTLAEIRSGLTGDSTNEYLVWALGVVLTVHIVNWLGITYFDQTNALWLLQLAALSTVTGNVLSSSPALVTIDAPIELTPVSSEEEPPSI